MVWRIESALRSETGPYRRANEDTAAMLEAPRTVEGIDGVYFVADGLGGHEHGEIASTMAAETILAAFQAHAGDSLNGPDGVEARLEEAVRRANLRIYLAGMTGESLHMNPERPGMGTTLTALVLADDRVVLGHVGDSRAYLLRHGVLTQVTEDQTVAAERVRQGTLTLQEARQSPLRNVLTQALGTREEVTPLVKTLVVDDGDIFLLCSDGLWSALSDEVVMTSIAHIDGVSSGVDALVEAALRADGRDNITAVVMRVLGDKVIH